jgi:bifunctional non-homologous end joining protein LigD
MLASRLEDPRRLADPRYSAEPKLDGQRAQVHVRGGRTAACYSRPGLDLLRHAGMAWLRDLAWPVESAIFDGEAVAGDGNEGIQAVFHERDRAGGAMAVILFDLLSLDGQSVMREPWTARRKRLEDALEGRDVTSVRLVPYTDDALGLWDTWVGMGGEGILLKDRSSIYRPGVRSPAWLKLKPKLTLTVTVTGGSSERITWGDWGEAVMLEFKVYAPTHRGRRGDPASRPRAPWRALGREDWSRCRASVLGRDAERGAAAPSLGPAA